MFITKEDLETLIYPEGIAAISRNDDTKVETAINNAQLEASTYLLRYDVAQIWAASDEDKELLYGHLIDLIKHIARWKFFQIGNVGSEFDTAEIAYKAALKSLDRISKTVQPSWPLLESDGDRPFRSGSRPKFDHHGYSESIDPDDPFQ